MKSLMQELPSLNEKARSVRRELDIEPNAQLQGSLERFGDAATALNEALLRPMTSIWNPIEQYFGKTPSGEVNQLAKEFDTCTQELQAAIRDYVAALDSHHGAQHARNLLRLPWRRRG